MTSVAVELQKYRYRTSSQHQVPWQQVRLISIPELRSAEPDLRLMTNMISSLSTCDISLSGIREHTDAEVLQLLQVLQACLQFGLWSQRLLKEKLLELQSTTAARQVTSKYVEAVELERDELRRAIQKLKEERDTLSLGSTSLRTALVKMETSGKMQERQLEREQQRSTELMSHLERLMSTQKRQDPVRLERPPSVDHPKQQRMRRPNSREAAIALRQKRKKRQSLSYAIAAGLDSEATSDAEVDSLLSAEAELCLHDAQRQLHSVPPVDWRSVVQYIIHELQGSEHAVRETDKPLRASATTQTTTSTSTAAGATVIAEVPSTHSFSNSSIAELRLHLDSRIKEVSDEVQEHTTTAMQQSAQSLTRVTQSLTELVQKAQESAHAELQEVLRSIPTLLEDCVMTALSRRAPPSSDSKPASQIPVDVPPAPAARPSLSTEKTAAHPFGSLMIPSFSAASLPQLGADAAATSHGVLPDTSLSYRPSAMGSILNGMAIGGESIRRPRASRSLMPSFSLDCLRTPKKADSLRHSSSSPIAEEKEKESSGASPLGGNSLSADSYRSVSLPFEDPGGAENLMRTEQHVPPSSVPPVYPGAAASGGNGGGSPGGPRIHSVPSSLPVAPGPTSMKGASLHSSMHSEASSNTHASSIMLREAQRELQALLEEENASHSGGSP